MKSIISKKISQTQVTQIRSEQHCPPTTTVPISRCSNDKSNAQALQHRLRPDNAFNELSRSKALCQQVKRHYLSSVPLLVRNASESDNESQAASFVSPSQRKRKNGPYKNGSLKHKHGAFQTQKGRQKRTKVSLHGRLQFKKNDVMDIFWRARKNRIFVIQREIMFPAHRFQ